MLQGIEILSQVSKWSASGVELAIGIICCVLFLIGLLGIIFEIKTDSLSVGFVIMLIVSIFFGFLAFTSYINRYEYTEYKVVFHEKVDMNEFNAKYNIVSQEGKIFTIKENR